jgi:hypothetical protein
MMANDYVVTRAAVANNAARWSTFDELQARPVRQSSRPTEKVGAGP